MSDQLVQKLLSRKEREVLRHAVLDNHWTPIPCKAKRFMPAGWTSINVTHDIISGWNRPGTDLPGTGIRLDQPDILIIDLDVSDPAVSAAILDRYRQRWPQFFAAAIERSSGAVKRAFFGRISAPLRQKRTATYTADAALLERILDASLTKAERKALSKEATLSGQKIELFGGLSQGRYFAFSGPHSSGRLYQCTNGRSPATVDFNDMPVFPAEDIVELLAIAEEEMARVLTLVPSSQAKPPGRYYDLTPEQTFVTKDGHEITLADLESELQSTPGAEHAVYGCWDWETYNLSDSHGHCKAFVSAQSGQLVIENWQDDTEHRYASEQPSAGLSEAAIATLKEIEAVQAASMFGGDKKPRRLDYGDLVGHAPSGRYIFRPTGELWPAATVDKRLPKVPTGEVKGKAKKPVTIAASTAIMASSAVEQMSWLPGAAEIVEDRVVLEGGIVEHEGARIYNLYRAPRLMKGDALRAGPWIEHVEMVFEAAGDAEHINSYLGFTAQYPGRKINHALLLGGMPGIGKDTALAPMKAILGAWNFIEITPRAMFSDFNRWQRTVMLRISELHDLGTENMYSLYERLKSVTTSPPETLPINDKGIPLYYVPNLTKVVMTTNHLVDGLYLPPDDRRTYVAWSGLKAVPSELYFDQLYGWLARGGEGHVGAYLRSLDLTRFNPMAPPVKTEAFWSIVNANRSAGDVGIDEVITAMTVEKGAPPDILAPRDVEDYALKKSMHDAWEWLRDRRHYKHIGAAFDNNGYVEVPNPHSTDRRWLIGGRKLAMYRRREISPREAMKAIEARQSVAEDKKSNDPKDKGQKKP